MLFVFLPKGEGDFGVEGMARQVAPVRPLASQDCDAEVLVRAANRHPMGRSSEGAHEWTSCAAGR